MIGKAHGLGGWFVLAQAQFRLAGPTRKIKEVVVGQDPEASFVASVAGLRSQGSTCLLRLAQLRNREAVEAFWGRPVWVKALTTGHPYAFLIGKPVVDAADQELGQLTAFTSYGASDLMVVTLTSGQSAEIPFVDSFIALAGLSPALEKITLTVDRRCIADFFH